MIIVNITQPMKTLSRNQRISALTLTPVIEQVIDVSKFNAS